MWVPVAVWQPCELLYTCYLLTYLLTRIRGDSLCHTDILHYWGTESKMNRTQETNNAATVPSHKSVVRRNSHMWCVIHLWPCWDKTFLQIYFSLFYTYAACLNQFFNESSNFTLHIKLSNNTQISLTFSKYRFSQLNLHVGPQKLYSCGNSFQTIRNPHGQVPFRFQTTKKTKIAPKKQTAVIRG